MSDMSPTLQNTDHVDWVPRRVACTTRGLLKLLKAHVRSDIDQFNQQSGTTGTYQVENGRGYMFQVTTRERIDDAVIFRVQGDAVTVHIGVETWGKESFAITHAWDQATATCVLTVDDEPLALWQISQRALLPLLFD